MIAPAMTPPRYAISLKQPWAALVAAGLKTVEVRTWPTARRGPVLVHASKTVDDRPEAWARITTPALERAAAQLGGIVGAVEVTGCVEYPDTDSFAADADRHYNAPSWFKPPRLYGFELANARPLPFVRLPGNTNFFPVTAPWLVVAPPERAASGKDFPDE